MDDVALTRSAHQVALDEDQAPAEAVPSPDHAGPVPLAGLTFAGSSRSRRAGAVDDPLGATGVPPEIAGLLVRRTGRGAALPERASKQMGDAFGRDFSAVRVHHDAQANEIARSVQARAFTHGSDLYFADGAYDPSNAPGERLLAHELTHVAQQQDGRDGAAGNHHGLTIGRADDPAEVEAEATASDVVRQLRRQAARPIREPDRDEHSAKLESLRRQATGRGGSA